MKDRFNKSFDKDDIITFNTAAWDSPKLSVQKDFNLRTLFDSFEKESRKRYSDAYFQLFVHWATLRGFLEEAEAE